MKRDELLRLIEEYLQFEPGALDPDTALIGLDDWDSMAVLEFQAIVDEKLSVLLDPDEIATCSSVGDLLSMVGPSLED